MHQTAIKTRLDVQVGYLYERRNAERGLAHATHGARQRRASALLYAWRRVPPCAAASAAPKPFFVRAESQILFSTGC